MALKSVLPVLVLCSFFAVEVLAAEPASPAPPVSDEPVEISAAGSLSWQRGEHVYTAEGEVVVVKGDMTLTCDRLTATYGAEKGGQPSDVERLEATGRVHFTARGHEAFGDRAVYDIRTQVLTLTGGNLRLVTPSETVTAEERFEYIRLENRLNAVGYAKATRGTESLQADTLSAFFTAGSNNALELRQIRAENNVVVTTAREKVFGTKGLWDAAAQKATLEGPVRIEQGESRLLGSRAEVDMKTGQSRIFAVPGAEGVKGRVKGVFFPARKE